MVPFILLAGCGDPGGAGGTGTLEQAICSPISCYGYGYTCGSASDGCGGTLNCGTCASGDVCTNHNCYLANCVPYTCKQLGANRDQTQRVSRCRNLRRPSHSPLLRVEIAPVKLGPVYRQAPSITHL
jgi:hypothetical protein